MCSERTKYKCRFGCSETFKTVEGRNHHEEMRHRTYTTPTCGTEKQLFDIAHFCTWNRSTRYQINVVQDRLNVDSC